MFYLLIVVALLAIVGLQVPPSKPPPPPPALPVFSPLGDACEDCGQWSAAAVVCEDGVVRCPACAEAAGYDPETGDAAA